MSAVQRSVGLMQPQQGARCRPLADLFASTIPAHDVHTLRQMRALCAACPLLRSCREFVAAQPVSGFVAGLTEWERGRPDRRARRRTEAA